MKYNEEISNMDGKPFTQSKYVSTAIEEIKDEIEAFDNQLNREELDESKYNESRDFMSIHKYKSSTLSKPAGMLARFNKSTPLVDNSKLSSTENCDFIQLGQGSQKEVMPIPRQPMIKVKQTRHLQNIRYKNVELKGNK